MRKSRQRGFTLFELIVAVLLTAIMATAVATVLRSLLGEQRRLKLDPYPSTLLNALLRRDLVNSTYYRITPEGLQLMGHNGSDPRTGQPNLTSAQVTLGIQPTQRGGLLVRTEIAQDAPPQAARRSSPLWLGVSAVRFETTVLEDSSFEENINPSVLAPVGWKRLPAAYSVVLVDDRGSVLTTESIAEVR